VFVSNRGEPTAANEMHCFFLGATAEDCRRDALVGVDAIEMWEEGPEAMARNFG
jgi:hypothetical protein